MEKIFTPNRWFISFCALLILVVGALKIVSDMHLAEEAKLVGMGIFDYDWHELGIESRVQSIEAHVISHNEHDAVVEVTGRQYIARVAPQPVAPQPVAQAPAPAANAPAAAPKLVAAGPPENAQFKAILTFYRANNAWELGKVEQVN